jgi:hypothetical protein
MAFLLLFFDNYLSGIFFSPADVMRTVNLTTLSKARIPLLGQVFSSHSRPLHPAAQVLCIIGLTIIAIMNPSEFSYCIGLAFPSGYTSPTCSPSLEFIDPESCRI